jgi:NMD protein affecting ribosome stability and mRNA decay
MAWHKAAESCQDELLENLWEWTIKLRLKPEELRNDVLLSTDNFKEAALHKAAEKVM